MTRALAVFLAFLMAWPAFATPRKPLVLGTSGQQQQIQAGDKLLLQAPTTGTATINLPQGTAPTSPANGDCWTTTAGLYCYINGATVGPYEPGTVTSLTCGTGLSGGTITTTGTCSITAPVTVALGGTNATTASGTALDNITGFSSTGFLTRTGSGTYAFQSTTNGVTLANLAQIGANTILGNATGSTANIVAQSMPSCSLVTEALTWTTSTGFGCQAPVPATSANPFTIGLADVGSALGSPPVSPGCANNLPEGSVCMRTDVGYTYSMWLPTTQVPARVQEASGVAASATLGVAPTNGNYLVAACFNSSVVSTLAAGWTSLGTHTSGGGTHQGEAYVQVGAKLISGDVAAQTPCSGGTGVGIVLWEVSGLDMSDLANSFQAISFGKNADSNTSNAVTLTATTSSANTLGLASFNDISSLGGNESVPTINAGWLNSTTYHGTKLAGLGAQQQFSSTSSSVTASGTAGVFGSGGYNAQVGMLLLLQPSVDALTTGYQQVSYLTVAKSGGTTITAGAGPRSLNFSTGLTASSDADGNVTITSTPTISGDCTTSAGLVITCTKSSGSAFGTFAFQNYATPPAIGGTTPAAGAFTTLSATGNLTTNVTGVAANCLEANTSGVVSGTGSGCGGGGGSGTVTSVTCTQGLSGGAITTSGTCGLVGSLTPQGRLTLVTGTPVMTADETSKATIYYDCYTGKAVPYYDGSNDQALTIGSCEISTALESSSTGVENSAGVFDVFAINVSGTLTLCVPTNGSGGGWASDTGGSNTARGTGYSQVHNTRGYVTNVNSITHCYNGATDEGTISADRGTYLGTFYTTAAGQTGVAVNPSCTSGGTNNFLGLWNAYNQVTIRARECDSKHTWTYASTTLQPTDGGSSNTANRISWVDGLQQSRVHAELNISAQNAASWIGFGLDSTTSADLLNQSGNSASATGSMLSDAFAPQLGLHFVSGLEAASGTVTFFGTVTGTPAAQTHALILELAM